jgi:hypothetical protein
MSTLQDAPALLHSNVAALRQRETLLRRLAGVSRAVGDEPQAQAGLREAERVRARVQALLELIDGDRASA